jgi:cobalt-zinc-cadmium efflux system membrane fusion protein
MFKTRIVAFAILAIAAGSLACGPQTKTREAEVKGPLDYPRGPHGARLLEGSDLQLEMTIYETGVPPHFRVYPLDSSGKPVPPAEVKLRVELHRLGGRFDKFAFVPEADYLRGDGVVEEPHSFDVKVKGERAGKGKDWAYSQIEGKVQLSDEVLKSTGIEIQEVGPRPMATSIELPGEIVADEARVAHVVARLSGRVSRVLKTLGDHVAQGELLAVIESRELAEARSTYLAAAHRAEFLKTVLDREEGLWKKKITAEREYLAARRDFEEAQLAEQVAGQKLVALGEPRTALSALDGASAEKLPSLELRSPLSGVVTERDLTVGETLLADHNAFVVADLSRVFVQAEVPAGQIAGVRLGQEARIEAKESVLQATGRVSYIGSMVGKTTRTTPLRIALTNRDGSLRPGLFVSVHLVEESSTAKLAVPEEAIQTFRDWQVVFVRYADWFEARPLELGRTDRGWVEVLSGLKPGERYAATNSYAIKAEIGKLGATHDH